MLAKKITYTDYNGNERTETFYFNLSKAELMDSELSNASKGGLEKMIQKLIDEKDSEKIMKTFKDIIFMAYGEKSDDGRRFIKSPELSKAFSETEAYVELFMEIVSNEEKAAEFINAIIPQELVEAVKADAAGPVLMPAT